jgi:hypothetical protein
MVGGDDGYDLTWSRNREDEIQRMATSLEKLGESRDSS